MATAAAHLGLGLNELVVPGALRRLAGGVLSAILLWTLPAAPADACQICVPMPEKTLADRLLASDAVVLAQEDPERPFHFAAVETLKGDQGLAPIETFLNSQARRVLAAYPDRRMLLARDPREGKWMTLGIADSELDRVVRRILSFSGSWAPMETDNPARLEEFARLLAHPNPRLHELAYLEVGRAPYRSIRTIASAVPIETVRNMLDDPRYLEWRSLAILMLAQSERPADRARIIETLLHKQRSASTLNLAAWATACIAVEGTACIERLERLYLTRSDRSEEELLEVIAAMSVHGSDDLALRERIASSYGALLDVHPAMASGIVRDLIGWRHWDLAEKIGRIRESWGQEDPLGGYSLDLYLRMARARHGRTFQTVGKDAEASNPAASPRPPSAQPATLLQPPSTDLAHKEKTPK
jgi:hypothetical protein